jgi:hypothetical protein
LLSRDFTHLVIYIPEPTNGNTCPNSRQESCDSIRNNKRNQDIRKGLNADELENFAVEQQDGEFREVKREVVADNARKKILQLIFVLG